MATERVFKILENSFPLSGQEVRVGDPAPDFRVISPDFRPLTLESFAGKTRIFLSLPSLDTSVCDAEAKEFSRRGSELSSTEIVVVSVDLPFALQRWCAAEGNENLTVGSDHRDLSFGLAYGVVVEATRQLARAAFVATAGGKITYVEYVPDIDVHPDFDAVIAAAREAEVATP